MSPSTKTTKVSAKRAASKNGRTMKRATNGDERMEMQVLARNLPALSRTMTFAKMVQEDVRFTRLKDLQWLFPRVCHRKS